METLVSGAGVEPDVPTPGISAQTLFGSRASVGVVRCRSRHDHALNRCLKAAPVWFDEQFLSRPWEEAQAGGR